jgi:peroxiredoxin
VELQLEYQAFQEAGAEVVAVAVASEIAVEGWRQDADAAFPVLPDPTHRVAESYGVYDLFGDGIAAPAAFVIETDGHVAWGYIGLDPSDRPDLQTILKQLQGL